MNDRALENLNKYDFTINHISRGRGGAIVDTDKGLKLFLECNKPDTYYLKDDFITRALVDNGFENVDFYMRNTESGLLTRGDDGKKYCIKNWYEGRECDVKNIENVLEAVRTMARLHICLNAVSAKLFMASSTGTSGENNYVKAASSGENAKHLLVDELPTEQMPMGEVSTEQMSMGELSTEQECMNRLCKLDVHISPKGAFSRVWESMDTAMNEEILELELKKVGMDREEYEEKRLIYINNHNNRDVMSSKEYLEQIKGNDLLKEYERHEKELKNVANYLRGKKNKMEFEQIALKYIDRFMDEAAFAVKGMKNRVLMEKYKKIKDTLELNHGSFNYHNIILNIDRKNESACTNFEKVKNGSQMIDLYQFLRKVCEKYNWDLRVAYGILDEYDRIKPLSDEDLDLISALVAFPEKFWKIINQYYNSSKTWVPAKNIEKLKAVCQQNHTRREFVDKMCGLC